MNLWISAPLIAGSLFFAGVAISGWIRKWRSR